MFTKLLVIVTCLGGVAAGLLAERHQRLASARQTILLRERVLNLREAEWALDLRIAERVHPDRLHATLAQLGQPLAPIVADPVAESDGEQTVVLAHR